MFHIQPRMLAQAAAAPPSIIGSQTNGVIGTTGTSLTFSHTTAAGTTKLVVVGHGASSVTSALTISSVTFNGVTMTLATKLTTPASGTPNVHTGIYYLDSPFIGTANVVITYSATSNNGICGEAYNLKDTQTGVDASNSAGVSAAQTASTTLTTTAATVVIGGSIVTDPNPCTWTWTNLTEDRDEQGSAATRAYGASHAIEAAAVASKTYAAISSVAASNIVNMSVAAFK